MPTLTTEMETSFSPTCSEKQGRRINVSIFLTCGRGSSYFCGPNTAKVWGWRSDAPSMMLENAVKTWYRVWKCPAGDHLLVDFLSSLVGIKVLYNVRVWHLFYRPISRLFRILVIWSLGNNNVPHKDNTAVQTKTKYAKYPPRYPLSIDSEKSEVDIAGAKAHATLAAVCRRHHQVVLLD